MSVFYTQLTLEHFIKNYLLDESFKKFTDILDICSRQGEKGLLYECIASIGIKLGLCSLFPYGEYAHLNGNPNTHTLVKIESLKNYFKDSYVSASSGGGCSDISLLNLKTGKTVVISSKYFRDDNNHSVADYDIQRIHSVYSIIVKDEPEIYLLVKDKKKVLEMKQRATQASQDITMFMLITRILDEGDVEQMFQKIRKLFKTQLNNYHEIDLYYRGGKLNLEVRFHQAYFGQRFLELHSRGIRKFLLGLKCRAGKTFLAGHFISLFYQLYRPPKLNVLVVSPAKKATLPEFRKLFETYHDFDHYDLTELNGENVKKIKFHRPYNIVLISKDFLDNYLGENAIPELAVLEPDFFFFDENDEGGTTELSKSIVETYTVVNTNLCLLTATYEKSLRAWDIVKDAQFFWTILDEQSCKSRSISELEKRLDPLVMNQVLQEYYDKGYTQENILSVYDAYPDMYMLTVKYTDEKYNNIMNFPKESVYGSSMRALHAIENDNFIYPDRLLTLFKYITGSDCETLLPHGNRSVFQRIVDHSNKICSRTKPGINFTEILWFLPYGPGLPLNMISTNLVKLAQLDPKLRQFDFLIMNYENSPNDINTTIKSSSKKACARGKKGLIIVVGRMCSKGISLPLVDIVFLFNELSSSDLVYQMMMRCMTESNGKKVGFVVDFNINRVLKMVEYLSPSTEINHTIQDKINYVLKYHMINLEVMDFTSKEVDTDNVMNCLIEAWQHKPTNKLASLLHQINLIKLNLTTEDQEIVNLIVNQLSGKSKTTTIIKFQEQKVPTGTRTIKNSEVPKEAKQKLVNKSFTKDILLIAIPLACIITLKDIELDLIEIFKIIKGNPDYLNIWNDETKYIWTNNKDDKNSNNLDLVIELTEKYIAKNSPIYNIVIKYKMDLRSIENPKELLEFIGDIKQDKDSQRSRGEVFTPLWMVDEMLDNLDAYIFKSYGKKVFTDPTYTWFDPATGMGNFQVSLYFRLMDGLSDAIPDEAVRQQHILENMIYMSELSKRNCFVLEQIFNPRNKYRLNINQGDSLTLDLKKKWNLSEFTLIIGNPPYNKKFDDNGGGASPLFHDFVSKYIDRCQYLIFIIPSKWFGGGKGLGNFRKKMMTRKDLSYIQHYHDTTKIFGLSVQLKGGINYFLKDRNYNGSCYFNGVPINLNKYDTIFTDPKLYQSGLLEHFASHKLLINLWKGRCFQIETNDSALGTGDLTCYVSEPYKDSHKLTKNEMMVDRTKIKVNYNYYKVITARASHKHCGGFGNIFIGNDNCVHTGSFVHFKVNSLEEAESLCSYLKNCKLPNLMLSLKRFGPDISKESCKLIPLVPLDRIWTDTKVAEYFALTKEISNLLRNTKISGYDQTYDDQIDQIDLDKERTKETMFTQPKKSKAFTFTKKLTYNEKELTEIFGEDKKPDTPMVFKKKLTYNEKELTEIFGEDKKPDTPMVFKKKFGQTF